MNTTLPSTTKSWTTNLDGIPALTLRTTPTPNPQTLPTNHILVRILSVSLNYKDAEIINGLFKHHKSSIAPPDLIPCADSVGVVVAVGPTEPSTAHPTPSWEVGAHVLSVSYPNYLTGPAKPAYLAAGVGSAVNGVLTTYRVFPSHGVVACPPSLVNEPDLACCLPIAGTTAWMGLHWWLPISSSSENDNTTTANQEVASRQSESLLLQGTGGVSTFGLLFAHALHMRTIITSSSDTKLQRARALSPKVEIINYRTTPNWDAEVLRLTDGEGVDIIFENGGGGDSAATNSTLRSMKCVSFGGRINAIGYVGGKTDKLSSSSTAGDGDGGSSGEGLAEDVAQQELRTNINVHALSRNFIIKGLLNGPRDRMEEMLRFVEQHKIKPVVDRVFPFEEAKEALQYLWDGKHFGKVVIRVADP